jgi:hypothetical protein
VARRALRHISHVPPGVPAVPAEAEALGALRVIAAALGKARLRHLNLSDNALGEKGIRAAAAAFSRQVRHSGWGGMRCASRKQLLRQGVVSCKQRGGTPRIIA